MKVYLERGSGGISEDIGIQMPTGITQNVKYFLTSVSVVSQTFMYFESLFLFMLKYFYNLPFSFFFDICDV